MRSLALPLLLLVVTSAAAQQPGAANREAMRKLDFLAGKWKGDASISRGPKNSLIVKQTEHVQFKLDNTILLVEGVGRGKLSGKDEEGIVFQALGVLSYDAEAKKYKIKAYRNEGQSVETDMTVTGKSFVWGFKDTQSGVEVRYTMTLTPKDEWHEIGEYSRGGKTWAKFIEMTLTRVKE